MQQTDKSNAYCPLTYGWGHNNTVRLKRSTENMKFLNIKLQIRCKDQLNNELL